MGRKIQVCCIVSINRVYVHTLLFPCDPYRVHPLGEVAIGEQ